MWLSILGLLLLCAVLLFGAFLAVGAVKTRYLAKMATQMVPQMGTLIDVPGGALHYLDIGHKDARPLVLIHGLSGQMQHFTYALSDLLKDDFRLILIDRPGCGYSRRDTAGEADLSVQARMIWQALDALDVENPVLVGHSLGGAVSLAMALQRPDATGALALLAPLTHPDPSPATTFSGLNQPNPTLRRILAHTWAIPLASNKAKETLDQVFHPEPWPQDFVLNAGGALGLRPKAFLTAVEDFLASDGIRDLSTRYGTGLTCPGGVLFGAQDAVLDPNVNAQPMSSFGFKVSIVPDRGHMLPITAPQDCAAFIRTISALA